MKNLFKKKWFKIVLAVIIAFVLFQILLAIVITVVSNKKSYRVIKLVEYSGNVEVSRKNALVELFNGLQLISGDESKTGDESIMSLLIDSDKHMLVTPNTRFEVKATGKPDNGKVKIDLMEGKAFFDVDNKLNESSTFEVITPNATTSIRGTKFAVTYDSADSATHVFVDIGTVEVFYGNNQSILVNDKEAVTIKDGTATLTKVQAFEIHQKYDIYQPDYMNQISNNVYFVDENYYTVSFDVDTSEFVKYLKPHNDELNQWFEESLRDWYDYDETNVSTWFPNYIVTDVGNGPEIFRCEKTLRYINGGTFQDPEKGVPYAPGQVTENGMLPDGVSLIMYVISEGPADSSNLEAVRDEEGKGTEGTDKDEPTGPYAKLVAGDIVEFGAYEQDGDESNGKETIEWQVVNNEDGRLYLISKYVLDCKPYHNKTENVTWETCTLRAWLNDEFLNAAFSAEEQNQIPDANIICDDDPRYGTDGGNDTMDKVFVPSISEIRQYIYDWGDGYGGASYDLFTLPTQYALNNGCKYLSIIDRDWYNAAFKQYGYPESIIGQKGSCWWLRTPGYDQKVANVVSVGGQVGNSVCPVDTEHATPAGTQQKVVCGVRPAIYLEY